MLSHSSFLSFPLHSSPPLNPSLLWERLVNPCVVSINAANWLESAGNSSTSLCRSSLPQTLFFPLCLNFSTLELSMASLSCSLTTIGLDSSFSSGLDLLVFHTCSFLSLLIWQTDRPAPRPRHSLCPTSFMALIDTSYTRAHTDTL